jgi:hypothetical protein
MPTCVFCERPTTPVLLITASAPSDWDLFGRIGTHLGLAPVLHKNASIVDLDGFFGDKHDHDSLGAMDLHHDSAVPLLVGVNDRAGEHTLRAFVERGWPVIGTDNHFGWGTMYLSATSQPPAAGHFHLVSDRYGARMLYTYGSPQSGVPLLFPDDRRWSLRPLLNRRFRYSATVDAHAEQAPSRPSGPFTWANISDLGILRRSLGPPGTL